MRTLALAVGVCCSTVSGQVLLVGTWFDSAVKMVDVTPGVVDGFLGDFVAPGSGGLSTTDGLAWGADRNLYVSSSDTGQVLRFHGRTGAFLGVFADGINGAGNLQFGPDGLLYVCEKGSGRVLRFDPETGDLIDVFVQGAELSTPVGLAWRDGVLFVSDFNGNRQVLRYDAQTGEFLGPLADLPGGPLIARLGPDDNIWVSAHQTDDISILDPVSGDLVRTINEAPVNCPVGHVLAPDGTTLVASWLNHRILRYDTDTGALIEQVAFDLSQMRQPNDLLFMIEGCEGDLTGTTDPTDPDFGVPDGVVDSDDFFYFLDRFAAGSDEADIDGDGDNDGDDFFQYLDFFSAGCP